MKTNIALMLSAASGLIYEIVATNLLFFYFIKSSYSMATVFSIFLLGLGIGSMLIHKYKHKIKDKQSLFGAFQIVIAMYSLLVLTNLMDIIPRVHTGGIFISSLLILLIPTILLGATFPLAALIISEKKKDSVGFVYSVDLVGAVIGSLIAGFFLVPIFGNVFAIKFAVILNLIAGCLMVKDFNKIVTFILIVVVGTTMIYSPPVETNIDYFESASPFGEVKYEDDQLFIDGRVQCIVGEGHSPEGETTIVDYSLDPFNNKDIQTANIGLGCGNTLQRMVDKVSTTVDIIEINPVVVEVNELFSEILDNKRVNLIIGEGLNYLRNTDKKYDSIIIDIEDPTVIHSSDIYTKEATQIVYDSLEDNGIYGLWSYRCDSEEYYDLIYYTLESVFPYVYKMNNNNYIASKQELEYEKYIPTTKKQINTINKKTLSNIYFDKCDWMWGS